VSASAGDIVIRPEALADATAVHALLRQAFGGPGEAALVDRLRAEGDLVLALVAVAPPETVAGYVAFPRLQVASESGTNPAIGLAPLAVAAPHRRRGIGAALVRAGLDRLIACRETVVFVLGDPAYYGRFGFDADAVQPFGCAYAGPHFQARRLAAPAPSAGTIRYPAAFDDLGLRPCPATSS
jgi:putative acetyltransferase